jgi:hypothetical protein
MKLENNMFDEFPSFSRCPALRRCWGSVVPPRTASSHRASCPSVDSAVVST